MTSGESGGLDTEILSIAALNKWSPELQCQILSAYLKGLAKPDCQTNSHVDGR